MKKLLACLATIVALVSLSSCIQMDSVGGNPYPPNNAELTKQTENPAEHGVVFESEKDVHNMFEKIMFDHSVDSDRAARSAEIMLNYPSNGYEEPIGYAVCIVTVMNIDVSNCSDKEGRRVPIQIRIDSIIENNPAFTLSAGDTIIVAEYSYWIRNQEGFSIAFPDGIIPISEKNAQYIVLMYNADESSKKELWTNLEYMVEALTIPIVENSDMTDDEVYAILKLPEDVSQCSRDLIEQFIVK